MDLKLLPHFTKRFTPASLYSLSGIILLIILLLSFNTYILHLKVTTAVIAATIEPIHAPLSGYISHVYIKQNQVITKGSPLAKVENNDIEKDLQMAKLAFEEAQCTVDYYQTLLRNEQDRLKLYQQVGQNRIAAANATVDIAKAEYTTTKKQFGRLQPLFKKRYLSQSDWDIVEAKLRTADDKLKNVTALMHLEHDALQSVDKGIYFTGNKVEGRIQDLEAEIVAAKKKLSINRARVEMYTQFAQKFVITAPFTGRVVQLFKREGSVIENTKPLLLLQEMGAKKQIVAYLTQNEVTHLRMRARVKVYVPALNQIFHGKVVEINRTHGFVDEVNAQYRFRELGIDRSAQVTIELQNSAAKNNKVMAGLPAIVYFSRSFNLF
ncbi:MAG: HlyD family efflux transporter periplasmic adaptor subunit [Gammaproteobacteria bacterium]|nr:HlyD family efflux transporter periplasmic adaptor subunit [Gammaproteobacteria bacterium]